MAATAWTFTRNILEAAAVASVHGKVRPISARDEKTGQRLEEWNLATATTPEVEGDPVYSVPMLRRDTASGALEKTTPLHPYLVSLHSFHSLNALEQAEKGRATHSVEITRGLHVLRLGGGQALLPEGTPCFGTHEQAVALASIAIGCRLVRFTGGTYQLSRFIAQPEPGLPAIDAYALLQVYRAGELWPAQRHSVYAQTLHAQYCLAVLRQHQQKTTFILVRHRTPFLKGAAFNAQAKGAVLGQVQKTLGVRIG